LKKKGHKNHPKKKVRALPFVLARWRQKKVGAEQEKVAPTHLPTKCHNISGPVYSLSPIGFCWVYF
jgi:hypothetical protein